MNNIRIAAIATAMFMAAIILSSCATPPAPQGGAYDSFKVAADAMAASVSSDPGDLAPLSAGIGEFLDFIARERGHDAAMTIAAMRSPAELTAFLEAKYDYTAYEEALAAFQYWSDRPTGPRWDEKKTERLETEHFLILTMPGTAAHADREYIARLLETEVANIRELIGPNESMGTAFERNLASIKGKKIQVLLPPDPRGLKNFGSTATTSYGLELGDSGIFVTASITLPYYNAMSSAILTHEVTHVLDIFFKLDARSAPPLPASNASKKERNGAMKAFAAWAKPTFEAIVPSDKGFGEGFGEFAAMRFSPIHRAFFPDPDELLVSMWKRVPPIDDILARSPTTKDKKIRIVRYTELNSFVTHLVDVYGLDRFLDFYMSVPVSEDRFLQVYGKNYKEMQADWKAALPR
jgi:hypothetical protein